MKGTGWQGISIDTSSISSKVKIFLINIYCAELLYLISHSSGFTNEKAFSWNLR